MGYRCQETESDKPDNSLAKTRGLWYSLGKGKDEVGRLTDKEKGSAILTALFNVSVPDQDIIRCSLCLSLLQLCFPPSPYSGR